MTDRSRTRDDLPWLRRRRPAGQRVPSAPEAPQEAPAPGPAPGARSTPQERGLAPSGPAVRPTGLDLSRPVPPATAPPRVPAAPAVATGPVLSPRPAGPTGLARPARRPGPAGTPATRVPASRSSWSRVRPGADAHLGPGSPTVALSRVQTGVGILRAGLLLPAGTPAPRLGCAWQQGVTQRWAAGGLERGSRRPVRVHDSPEELDVDLLAVHPLARLLVVAWPAAGAAHPGGGLLVLRTEGGSRVDAPLPAVPAGGSAVLLSGYVVDGELVLRAEGRVVGGGPARASAAYGYDALRWLDDHQPVP